MYIGYWYLNKYNGSSFRTVKKEPLKLHSRLHIEPANKHIHFPNIYYPTTSSRGGLDAKLYIDLKYPVCLSSIEKPKLSVIDGWKICWVKSPIKEANCFWLHGACLQAYN